MVYLIKADAVDSMPDIWQKFPNTEIKARVANRKLKTPKGFPLLFSKDYNLIEAASEFLYAHCVVRKLSDATLKTYGEILYDWFDTLEQSGITWTEANASDLALYRDLMLNEPSSITGKTLKPATINLRLTVVDLFYRWAKQNGLIENTPLVVQGKVINPRSRFAIGQRSGGRLTIYTHQNLPRPLTISQVKRLLGKLPSPYDLMARWQLYTGARRAEVCDIKEHDVPELDSLGGSGTAAVAVTRKGGQKGNLYAPFALLRDTNHYITGLRKAIITNHRIIEKSYQRPAALFLNSKGGPCSKLWYAKKIKLAAEAINCKATTHTLRATYGCAMLAGMQAQAHTDDDTNTLLVLRTLMGHKRTTSLDSYLRMVEINKFDLEKLLDGLYG